jgi:hypothetical protein
VGPTTDGEAGEGHRCSGADGRRRGWRGASLQWGQRPTARPERGTTTSLIGSRRSNPSPMSMSVVPRERERGRERERRVDGKEKGMNQYAHKEWQRE